MPSREFCALITVISKNYFMKLFIDSANVEEIKAAAAWGIIDGVTTNPSLVAKEGGDFKQRILEICRLVDGPVSAEVLGLTAEEMVAEAKELAQWHKNVVVKIPCTVEGLKAVKRLARMKIKTNVTLVFSVAQVLAVAKAGAAYVSIFVGRLDDAGEDGMKVVEKSMRIIQNYHFETRLIVASVRQMEHVESAALLGAHIATVPFKILEQMTKHPLTDAGIQKFLADWRKASV